MGTFFHGSNSEIQSSGASAAAAGGGDGFHTLYLLNPSSTAPYVPYSDTSPHPQPTPNMLLLNPNSPPNALHLTTLSHAPPPSSSNHNPDDPTPPSFLGHEISTFHGFTASAAAAPPPRVHYNLWSSMIDPHPTSAVATASSSSGGGPSTSAALDASSYMSFRRPTHQQGLSLSLSSQQTSYKSLSGEFDVPGQPQAAAIPTSSCDDVRILVPSNHPLSNGISNVQSFVLGSKYLRAAQEILDEVVNVGTKGINQEEGAIKEKTKANKESTSGWNRDGLSGGDGGGGGENSENGKQQGGELSTAQRQELQMKKSKLVTIFDEVEQRYRQYHHQMQIVLASFEQAAGYGAAKTYTSLALKTISKQFRCLKDAIASQIRATSKTLGEDDCLGAKLEGSRLRFVDHHLRQQRALQQLGMIQHNAWRPQRGLPERAVSILRAWLFEHFLHPYPKDSDKVMLAKQTGLTRSQVSNWFINARVRLWKPMVEEMYMEEMKEQDGNNNKEVGSTSTNKDNSQPQDHHQVKGFQSNHPDKSFNNQTTTIAPTDISNSTIYLHHPHHSSSGFPGPSSHHHHHDMQIRTSPKKPRSSEVMNNSPSSILSVDMEMKPGDHNTDRLEGNTTNFGMIISNNHGNDHGGGGGYGGFTMEEMGRYNVTSDQLAPRFHGNGVSLTLGLPHSTDNNLPSPGFLSNNMNLTADGTEFCAINAPPQSHSNISYENIDHIQNRKRFAAQLLPDFVA